MLLTVLTIISFLLLLVVIFLYELKILISHLPARMIDLICKKIQHQIDSLKNEVEDIKNNL